MFSWLNIHLSNTLAEFGDDHLHVKQWHCAYMQATQLGLCAYLTRDCRQNITINRIYCSFSYTVDWYPYSSHVRKKRGCEYVEGRGARACLDMPQSFPRSHRASVRSALCVDRLRAPKTWNEWILKRWIVYPESKQDDLKKGESIQLLVFWEAALCLLHVFH